MLPGRRYTPADIWSLTVRYRWLIVLPWIGIAGIVALVAQALPDRYKAESLIQVVPQRVPQSLVRSTVTDTIDERLPVITNQILSRTKLERIVQDFQLYTKERADGVLMEDIIARMKLEVKVQAVKGDSFRVSYESEDPRTAEKVTSRLSSLFVDENVKDRENIAQGANAFLESQLDDARRRLLDQEKRVEEYRKQFSGELPTQQQANLSSLQSNRANILNIQEAIIRDRDQRREIERDIERIEADAMAAQQAPALPTTTDPAAIERQPAIVRLQLARAVLAQLQTTKRSNHPDVQAAMRQVRDFELKAEAEALSTPVSGGPVAANPLEAQRARQIRDLHDRIEQTDRLIAQRENTIKRLEKESAELSRRVEASPTRESEMIALNRDYNTLQSVYTELLKKSEDAKVSANLERRQIGEQFKIIDAARVPEKPFSPNRLQFYAAGIFGGLAIGIGLVVGREYRDSSLRNDHDVLTALALPVLAIIPAIITQEDRRYLRRKRLIVAAAGAAVGCLAGVALVAWRFNLLQRLF